MLKRLNNMRFIRKRLYYTQCSNNIEVSQFILNKENEHRKDNKEKEIIRLLSSIENEIKVLNKNLLIQTKTLHDIKNWL
jgi:hypothetical protein